MPIDVHEPGLLALLVDAAGPVDRGLNRPQHRRQEGALAVEDSRHIAAEHRGDRDDDGAVKQNLKSSQSQSWHISHLAHVLFVPENRPPLFGITRLEPLGPQQSVGEVEQQPRGHEAGERIVENHGSPPQSRSQA